MSKLTPRWGPPVLLTIALLVPLSADGQQGEELQEALSALELREVGPAVAGGRIADIKVDPTNSSVWYVAVGSGGLWKTSNAGTTWTPVFDDQPSYSIGTVAIDPTNP